MENTIEEKMTLSFPKVRAEVLLKLINSGLKAEGLIAAESAAYFYNLIQEQIKKPL